MLDPPFADDFFFDFRTWKKKKRRKKGHILKYSCIKVLMKLLYVGRFLMSLSIERDLQRFFKLFYYEKYVQ